MMVVALGAFLAMASVGMRDAHAASGPAFDGSTLSGTWHFHFEGRPMSPANTAIPSTVAAFGWFTIEVSSDPNVLNVTGGKAWINVGGIFVDRGSDFEFPMQGGTLRLRDANVGVYGSLDSQTERIVMAGDSSSGGSFLLEYCHIMLDDRRGQSGRMTGRLAFTDPSNWGISVVSGTITKQ
jgi:hypothetical protein